jgi:hypothetical protein
MVYVQRLALPRLPRARQSARLEYVSAGMVRERLDVLASYPEKLVRELDELVREPRGADRHPDSGQAF